MSKYDDDATCRGYMMAISYFCRITTCGEFDVFFYLLSKHAYQIVVCGGRVACDAAASRSIDIFTAFSFAANRKKLNGI